MGWSRPPYHYTSINSPVVVGVFVTEGAKSGVSGTAPRSVDTTPAYLGRQSAHLTAEVITSRAMTNPTYLSLWKLTLQ